MLGSVLVPSAAAAEIQLDNEIEVFAFHATWDPAARTSLANNIDKIDTLLPELIHLGDENGAIADIDSEQSIALTELIRAEKPALKVAPIVNNYADGRWQDGWLQGILADAEKRIRLIKNLAAFTVDGGHHGLTVNFQGINPGNQDQFLIFVRALHATLRSLSRELYVTVPFVGDTGFTTKLAAYSDGLIVLTEGQHAFDTAAGPMAGQQWFEDKLKSRIAQIPASKLIIGVTNYANEWSDDGTHLNTYSVQEALTKARISQAEVGFDPDSLNPHFTYRAEDGGMRHVWFLDAATAFNQIRFSEDYRPRGIALWRLGTEDTGIWKIISGANRMVPASLEVIDSNYQLDRFGEGEIVKLTATPQTGSRTITVSGDGKIITGEHYTHFPRNFELMQWGARDDKALALTFDDGPDPVFTPLILEILKRHDVPATFFVVGANVQKYPDLVRRMVAEGHEVGSHTYSHANVSAISDEHLRLELNATQRVFESITGRNMVLFRAPYAEDTNPQHADEVRPISVISALNYYAVNMNIDPKDWWLPSADRIVQRTLAGARSGNGNIILLHDAGGRREATIEALPSIITQLRAEGYHFETAGALIGKSPDMTMPASRTVDSTYGVAQSAGFATLRWFERFVYYAFYAAIFLGILRSVIILTLSFLRRRRQWLHTPKDLSIGVVVPAYNEEKVVIQTVYSLLKSDYPNLEILVVDDGSKDRTYQLCRKEFKTRRNVTVLTKQNGGKSEALNYGFTRLDSDVIVALDADTVFYSDTISMLARHFSDPRVAAVSGNAKVGNRVNLLTKWQALEYITAQNLDRRAFEYLNGIIVVPGAVGAWRREAVEAVGGFTTDTLAEDADLTLRLLRAGHKVDYEEESVALTEAPETVLQFTKQRFRWMFGMLQVAYKHKDSLLLQDSKTVGLAVMPNILVFQILFPLLAPVADIFALIALGSLAWSQITNSTLANMTDLATALSMFFLFAAVDFVSAVAAFWHERRENRWLLIWLIPQRFFYRQLLYIVAIRAVITAVRGSMVGWGTLTRTAHAAGTLPAKAGRT